MPEHRARRSHPALRAAALFLACSGLLISQGDAHAELPLEKIQLPPGFKIEVFAEGLDDARSLTRSPEGVIYVGTRRAGNVYAVEDRNGDFEPERIVKIAEGLRAPNGVAWRDGTLYVAEIGRLLRWNGIDAKLDDPPKPAVVTDEFPEDVAHGWKFIAFGPDGKLYVPIGAPCNICDPELPYAAIHRLSPEAGEREVYARGIRNSVGFDWHPETGVLWFTDNGRDMLGDDIPPDELNRAPEPGLHFGYPFCHGKDIKDPELGDKGRCGEHVAPVQELGPHVAALGMRFYTGEMFPQSYRRQIFIAEHGSWNRSTPLGYRIMLVTLEGDRAVRYAPFAEGWLGDDGNAWGRPVDLLNMPDGSLLVSDDKAGAIYRISYAEPAAPATSGE